MGTVKLYLYSVLIILEIIFYIYYALLYIHLIETGIIYCTEQQNETKYIQLKREQDPV